MIEWRNLLGYTQIPPKSVKLTDTEYQIDLKEVVLSRGDVEKEVSTGQPSAVRINVEKGALGGGYSVYPEWQDILDEIGDRGQELEG